jgi:hypothetical protein
MKNIKFILLGIVLSFIVIKSHAQELISSAGSSFSSTDYSMEWSIGELAVSTLTSSNYILTQGFHQGIIAPNTVFDNIISDIQVKAFPNPVEDELSISINTTEKKLQLEIYDIAGALLYKTVIYDTKKLFKHSFNAYSMGVYQINLNSSEGVRLRQLKIVKL